MRKDLGSIQSSIPREISIALQQNELVRLNEELKRAREELSAARVATEKQQPPPKGPAK